MVLGLCNDLIIDEAQHMSPDSPSKFWNFTEQLLEYASQGKSIFSFCRWLASFRISSYMSFTTCTVPWSCWLSTLCQVLLFMQICSSGSCLAKVLHTWWMSRIDTTGQLFVTAKLFWNGRHFADCCWLWHRNHSCWPCTRHCTFRVCFATLEFNCRVCFLLFSTWW